VEITIARICLLVLVLGWSCAIAKFVNGVRTSRGAHAVQAAFKESWVWQVTYITNFVNPNIIDWT
jgi:hypothetical protein